MNKQWKVRLLWPHVSHVYCWTFIIYVPWTAHTMGFLSQSSFKLTLVLVEVLVNICNLDYKLLQIKLYYGFDKKIHNIKVSVFLSFYAIVHSLIFQRRKMDWGSWLKCHIVFFDRLSWSFEIEIWNSENPSLTWIYHLVL